MRVGLGGGVTRWGGGGDTMRIAGGGGDTMRVGGGGGDTRTFCSTELVNRSTTLTSIILQILQILQM